MEKYSIALVQMKSQFLNKEANIEKAVGLIEEAAANGAELICLPEGFNTGYFGGELLKMIEKAERLDGRTISRIKEVASNLGVHIVAPIMYQTANGKCENTAVFIDDEGNIIGTYSKTHPVGDERKYMQRGTEYPVWETKLGKIGILICYDVCFPETSRILALKGAELVIVPAAWRASHYFKEWWDINLSCRALDNLCYIAAVNMCGETGDEIFAGKSQVVSPLGVRLVTCGVKEERILYHEIDLTRISKERDFNTVLIDRHPEDYGLIMEKYK